MGPRFKGQPSLTPPPHLTRQTANSPNGPRKRGREVRKWIPGQPTPTHPHGREDQKKKKLTRKLTKTLRRVGRVSRPKPGSKANAVPARIVATILVQLLLIGIPALALAPLAISEAVPVTSELAGVGAKRVWGVWRAAKAGTRAFELFLVKDREDGRQGKEGKSKLTPAEMKELNTLIQTEVCNPAVGDPLPLTAQAVQDLIRNRIFSAREGNTDNLQISLKTCCSILYRLGFEYGKLKRFKKMTEERRARIETYLSEYASGRDDDDVIDCWMDESFVHQNHSKGHGWMIPDKSAKQVNARFVEGETAPTGPTSVWATSCGSCADCQLDPSGARCCRDERIGTAVGYRGKRLIMFGAICSEGLVCELGPDDITYSEEARQGTYGTEGDIRSGKKFKTAQWCFQAGDSRLKDYHKNVDGFIFQFWLKNKFIPAFQARFPGKRARLILDNAPYHWHYSSGIPVRKVNRVTVNPKLHETLTLEKIARDHDIRELSFRRAGAVLKTTTTFAEKPNSTEEEPAHVWSTPTDGRGITVPEMRVALKEALSTNPATAKLMLSDAQSVFEAIGWILLFAAPYTPKFNTIELLWRNTKNHVASNYPAKARSIYQIYCDVACYWYGGITSRRKLAQPQFSADIAKSLIFQCHEEMDLWIRMFGCRCSGSIVDGTFVYDASKVYKGGYNPSTATAASELAAEDEDEDALNIA